MLPEVERLATDSGELIAVTGRAVPGDRFSSLFVEFSAGTLQLVCDGETDEIVASVIDSGTGHPHATHDALVDLAGLTLEYAWELRNHRGYLDGFQVRLKDGHGREDTLQFDVGASALDVRRVVR